MTYKIERELFKSIYIENHQDDKLNYDFDPNSDVKKLYTEISKIIELKNSLFFENGVMLTRFNSNVVVFGYRFDYFSNLLKCAIKNEEEIIIEYVSDFICSYKYSLSSKVYKEDDTIGKICNCFFLAFNEFNFNNSDNYINQKAFSYFDRVKNMLIEKNKLNTNYLEEFVPKLFNTKSLIYNSVLENLLKYDNLVDYLIDYDSDIISHASIYNDYLLHNNNNVGSFGFYRDLNIMVILDREKCLFSETLKLKINSIIESLNKLLQNQESNDIRAISEYESIFKTTCFINGRIKNTKDITFTDKLNEINRVALNSKKKFIESKVYEEKMTSFRTSINYNDNLKKQLSIIDDDLSNLYYLLNVDFDEILYDSIKDYKEHAISYDVDNVVIDEDNGIYKIWSEGKNKLMRSYYDLKGTNIVNSFEDKTNIIHIKEFYSLMEKHLNRSYRLIPEIIYYFKKDIIEKSIVDASFQLSGLTVEFKNVYSATVSNIVITEALIKELGKQLECVSNKPSSLLDEIFQKLGDIKSERNIICTIYYCLYSGNGLGLRNDYIHGNKIKQYSNYPDLIISFACLMGISLIVQEYENR